MTCIFRIISLCLLLFITSNDFLQVSLGGGVENPHSSFRLYPANVNRCPVAQHQCGHECNRRCSATSHRKPCLFFCNKCCNKCLCVPSGTFANKECCACYNNWKTKEGGPKCP